MANYASLKSDIQQYIKQNGNNEITGALLQQELLAMVNSLGAGYQYMGCATPTTNPGTPDQNVFYFAGTAGTYTNFGGLVVENEAAILKYNGSWTREYTGIKFVTVSQNTPTGTNHTRISVGGNSYDVASVEDVSQLDQKVVLFPFTDNGLINKYLKELYIPQSIYNISGVTTMRIYKAYYDGSSYRTGIHFLGTPNFIAYKTFSTEADAEAAAKNIWEHGGIYAVIDWVNIQDTLVVEPTTLPNTRCYDLHNSPTIYAYLNDAEITADVVKQDDITIDIVSKNIANPANIEVGKFVNSSGTISVDVQNLWTLIKIPITPLASYTMGGFVLNRTSNWYAFYNGATLVSNGEYNPNSTPILTLQAPAGATDLYINIKSRETGSNYDNLQVNLGTQLQDYDEFKEAVTKIIGYDVYGVGEGGGEDLSTIIVDLPVSNGTNIASGYAYIDSIDRTIKVKA